MIPYRGVGRGLCVARGVALGDGVTVGVGVAPQYNELERFRCARSAGTREFHSRVPAQAIL